MISQNYDVLNKWSHLGLHAMYITFTLMYIAKLHNTHIVNKNSSWFWNRADQLVQVWNNFQCRSKTIIGNRLKSGKILSIFD
jgi:hypothetical protein